MLIFTNCVVSSDLKPEAKCSRAASQIMRWQTRFVQLKSKGCCLNVQVFIETDVLRFKKLYQRVVLQCGIPSNSDRVEYDNRKN
jgi:hypothetical protein